MIKGGGVVNLVQPLPYIGKDFRRCHGGMVRVIGHGLDNLSSNPGRGCLHFT